MTRRAGKMGAEVRDALTGVGFVLTEEERMVGQWGYDRPVVRGHGRAVDVFAIVFPEYALWLIDHEDGTVSIVTVNDYSERLALRPGLPRRDVTNAVLYAADEAEALT